MTGENADLERFVGDGRAEAAASVANEATEVPVPDDDDGLDDAMALAQAAAAGLAEMFLPALLMTEAEFPARFATGVVSVSSVLFFSASIPCILSTTIPLSVGRIVVVWFLRTALSLLLAVPAGYLAMAMSGG